MYLFPLHKDIKLIYSQLQTYIICRYRYCILTFTARDIPQTGIPVPTSRQDAREKKLFKPVWGARRPDTKHFQPTGHCTLSTETKWPSSKQKVPPGKHFQRELYFMQRPESSTAHPKGPYRQAVKQEYQSFVAFSSFFIIEKMNTAEMTQRAISMLHNTQRGSPPQSIPIIDTI